MCQWFLKFNFLLPCCWRMYQILNCRNIITKQMWSKASICLSLPTQQLFPFLSAESIFMNTLSVTLWHQKKCSPVQHSTEILMPVLIYTPNIAMLWSWPKCQQQKNRQAKCGPHTQRNFQPLRNQIRVIYRKTDAHIFNTILRIKEFRKTRETDGVRGGQGKGEQSHAHLDTQCGHAQSGD